MNKFVKYPCRGCFYFAECGDNMRTVPCKGRKTKRDIKKEKISKNKRN